MKTSPNTPSGLCLCKSNPIKRENSAPERPLYRGCPGADYLSTGTRKRFLLYAEQQLAVGGEGPVLGSGLGLRLIGYGSQLAHGGNKLVADEGRLLGGIPEGIQAHQLLLQAVHPTIHGVHQGGQLAQQLLLIAPGIS